MEKELTKIAIRFFKKHSDIYVDWNKDDKEIKSLVRLLKVQKLVNVDQRVMPTLAGMPQIIYKNSRHLKEDKPYGIRDNSGYLFFFVDISHYEGQDGRYEEELKQQQLLAEYLLAKLSKCSV